MNSCVYELYVFPKKSSMLRIDKLLKNKFQIITYIPSFKFLFYG